MNEDGSVVTPSNFETHLGNQLIDFLGNQMD